MLGRADNELEVVSAMHATAWSLLPFAVVIPLSIVTRQVIPGLVAGLLAGAWLLSPSWLGGVDTALQYLFLELTVAGNLHLLAFLYLFGSFVGMVRITGGVKGLAHWLEPRIHTAQGAYAVTWLSALGTFMAPDFRIIAVAPILRPIIKKLGVSPERLGYVIDATATPLISLLPIGTAFVGFMVGLVAIALKHVGVTRAPYAFFLTTIPFNFFAVVILAMAVYTSFLGTGTHRQSIGERIAKGSGRQLGFEIGLLGGRTRDDAPSLPRIHERPDDYAEEPLEIMAERAKPIVSHLLVPIILLLILTFFLTWWDGHRKAATLFDVLMRADAAKAMLQAVFITLLASLVFYLFHGQRIDRVMYGIVAGGNEMMTVILLLILVWAVSAVSMDLGFSQYVAQTIGGMVPRQFIAPALFVFGSLISYFIGSSFGTWGILLPLGFSLAITTHASLPLIAGAVFASGTLGGFASPLSDNTVAMATVMKLPVMDFARGLLKPTLIAGGIATIGYAVAGFVF